MARGKGVAVVGLLALGGAAIAAAMSGKKAKAAGPPVLPASTKEPELELTPPKEPVMAAPPKPIVAEPKPPPAPPPPPDDEGEEEVPTPPAAAATVQEKVLEAIAEAAKPAPPTAPAEVPTGPAMPVLPGSGPPPGFDVIQAATRAPAVAEELRTRKYDYSRATLKGWQRVAGLPQDGHYGGATYGALDHFVPGKAPPALFKPTAKQAYPWAHLALTPILASAPVPVPIPTPGPPAPSPSELGPELAPAPPPPPDGGDGPPAGFNVPTARRLAKQVANNITNKKYDYSRQLLRDFQRAAGLTADGLYGGTTHGALIALGVPRPPSALFKPTASVPYRWSSQAAA